MSCVFLPLVGGGGDGGGGGGGVRVRVRVSQCFCPDEAVVGDNCGT